MYGLLYVFALALTEGCAVHYYDSESGIYHIVGFGHFAYTKKAEPGNLIAVSTQLDTLGLGAASLQNSHWILLGANRHTNLDILQENTCFHMRWTNSALINVSVGKEPPEDFGYSQNPCINHEDDKNE